MDNKKIPPKCVQRVRPLIFLLNSPSTEFLMRSCCVPFFDGGYYGGVRALRFEPHPDKAAEPSRTFVVDPFTRTGRAEQNRCGLPPVLRGVKGCSHHGQRGRVILRTRPKT